MASTSTVPAGDSTALLRRLWRDWLCAHWLGIAGILGLVAVIAGTTSLYPLVIKWVFDAFAAQDLAFIRWSVLFILAVTAVKGVALLGQILLTNSVVSRVEAEMQTALYAHLVDADIDQLARESAAATTQRFSTDFIFIKEALTRAVNVFIRDMLMTVGLVGAMFWIDWQLSLIVLLVVPFIAVPMQRMGRKIRRVATTTQEQTGAMAALVSESLAGIRVAKAYRLERYLKERAARAFDTIRRLKMKTANTKSRLDPLLEIGGGAAVAGVLWLVGVRLTSGAATVGDFTGFLTALLLAAQPMRSIGNLNAIVQEALASLARIFALMDEKPTIVDRPGAVPLKVSGGQVTFEDVRFRYRDDVAALEGVDSVAQGGRTTALVGRSGSGKSTLLALALRLREPQAGRIRIDGADIAGVTLASLRDAIAFVAQDEVLFDDTIRANIAFGRPGAGDAAIRAAAEAAAIAGMIERLPEGYDTRVGERGGRLSGGERQRVALARAFLKDAPILLLDEATSALDAESEQLVQEALGRLMKGRTTIVIAHRLSTVRNADQIVVMDAGRVVERGTHEELLRADGAYARLYRFQFQEADVERGEPAAIRA